MVNTLTSRYHHTCDFYLGHYNQERSKYSMVSLGAAYNKYDIYLIHFRKKKKFGKGILKMVMLCEDGIIKLKIQNIYIF